MSGTATRNSARGAVGQRARRVAVAATGALALTIGAGVALVGTSAPAGAVTTWSPSGGCGTVQTTTVPVGVFSMSVNLAGGNGGRSGSQASSATVSGGTGSQVVGTFAVTPGQTISAVVACNGANGGGFANSTAPAGFSPGGTSGRGSIIAGQAGASGGTGGGSSAVCVGATCASGGGSTPLAVAGGGGGGGVSNCAGTPPATPATTAPAAATPVAPVAAAAGARAA